MALILKSYQQILGDQIRTLMARTGLNDLNKGSALLTLLEANAQEIFAEYATLIEILDSFNLNNLTGIDLDNKAAEYGLTRLSSTNASGYTTIEDNSFSKVLSSLYLGSTPPVAGNNVLNIADGEDIYDYASQYGFGNTKIYIGRGTANLEGPIALSGLPINNNTYWTLPLATALAKNHDINEKVILAQGGNRSITSGTIVQVPANNVSPIISFRVVNSTSMADGEDTLNNILVIASEPGTTGNVPLRSISEFATPPFSGASVTNLSAFSNARDLETDQELRDRITTYIQSLSRGTATAVLSGVIGITDTDENKRVVSASLIEPTSITDIAKLYIDDGTGFEPSYTGKGDEDVIADAVGTETFLQLGNYPLVKAQIESVNEQPYELEDNDTLIIEVNNIQEIIIFHTVDFTDISAARAIEIAEAINNSATLIEARTTDGQLKVVLFAKALNNEVIQVIGGTANDVLQFPTEPIYTLKLYKNDILLSKDGETAWLESAEVDSWSTFASPYRLYIQVDSAPIQYIEVELDDIKVSFDNVNFTSLPNPDTFQDRGVTITSASLQDWAVVLGQAIIGATVTVNGDKLRIESNIENSSLSQLQIIGGSLATTQGWSLEAVQGKMSEYTLNRFNGQIELAMPLVEHDKITASTANTRAKIVSQSTTGTFDLTTYDGRVAEIFLAIDGNATIKDINIDTSHQIEVTNTAGAIFRYTITTILGATPVDAFSNLSIGDYIIVVNKNAPWVGAGNTGIFRVSNLQTGATVSWFEVINPSGSAAGPFDIISSSDLQAFSSDVVPQRIQFPNGNLTPSYIASTINEAIIGATASVTDENEIEIITNSYDENYGSIQQIAFIGNASNLAFPDTRATNISSHIANVESSSQLGFRIGEAYGNISTADTTVPYTSVIDAARAFTTDGITKPNQWVKYFSQTFALSSAYDVKNCINKEIKSVINSIVSGTELLLRDYTPASGLSPYDKNFLNRVPIGAKYQQFYPFDLNGYDNLVVVIDNDSTNKTYNIPLYRNGRVTASSGVNDFDGADMDSNVSTTFSSPIWTGYNFADYKIWMKARRVLDPTGANNGFIIRAVSFGPTGESIRFIITYADAPDSALETYHVSSSLYTTVNVVLGTGSLRPTLQDNTSTFDITVLGAITTYTLSAGTDPDFLGAGVVNGDIVTFNSPSFSTVNNGTFKIQAVGAGFISVYNANGFAEAGKTLSTASNMLIYPLSGNTGTTVIDIINNTDPVNKIIEAVLGTGETGAGIIEYSSKDDSALSPLNDPAGSGYIPLVDGENWVSVFSNASPNFILKKALQFINVGAIYNIATCPNKGISTLGEFFRLIPSTTKNIIDHFNKSTITALSSNAVIERSNEGDKIQISSKLIGSQGAVQVTGGAGNSNVALIQDSASIDGSALRVSILSSSNSGLHKGQLIKIVNSGTTIKQNTYYINTPVEVASITSTKQRYYVGKRLTNIVSGFSTVTVAAAGAYWRYTLAVAGDFNTTEIGDELQITAASGFDPRNQGNFPIMNVDPSGTYVEVLNPNGVAEAGILLVNDDDLTVNNPFFTYRPIELDATTEIAVEYLSNNVYRYRWTGTGSNPYFSTNGMKVEDYIVIEGSKFAAGNRGTFRVIDVRDTMFEVVNERGLEEVVNLGEDLLPSTLPNITVTKVGDLVTYTLASDDYEKIMLIGDILTVSSSSPFNAANRGNFKVITATNTAITVYNPAGLAEGPIVMLSESDMQYQESIAAYSIDSAVIGDSLFVGTFVAAGWFESANQGILPIIAVERDPNDGRHYVDVTHTTFKNESVALGSNYQQFYIIHGEPYESYRTITNIAINETDTSKTFIYFKGLSGYLPNGLDNPIVNYLKITSSFASQIYSMNKLGFDTDIQVGIDGYKYWTGLLRRVQRTIDGYAPDRLTFPGLKAAGVQIDVLPPLLQRVSIGVDIRTSIGVSVAIVTDPVKSAILSYINSLGVGQDIILSQIVKVVQEVPGVESVTIVNPAPTDNVAPERIIIQDNEKAIAFADDIVVG